MNGTSPPPLSADGFAAPTRPGLRTAVDRFTFACWETLFAAVRHPAVQATDGGTTDVKIGLPADVPDPTARACPAGTATPETSPGPKQRSTAVNSRATMTTGTRAGASPPGRQPSQAGSSTATGSPNAQMVPGGGRAQKAVSESMAAPQQAHPVTATDAGHDVKGRRLTDTPAPSSIATGSPAPGGGAAPAFEIVDPTETAEPEERTAAPRPPAPRRPAATGGPSESERAARESILVTQGEDGYCIFIRQADAQPLDVVRTTLAAAALLPEGAASLDRIFVNGRLLHARDAGRPRDEKAGAQPPLVSFSC